MKTLIFIIFSLQICYFCASCTREGANSGGVIALTPSLTEAVWAVGLPEGMVLAATSPYTTDPRAEGLVRLDAVGSLERIVALKPSLVLLHPSDQQLAKRLEALKIPVLMHSMDTVEDVESTLIDLGARLHRETAATQAVERLRTEMNRNRTLAAGEKHQILLMIDRLDMRLQQFYIAQPPAFIATLVEGCGYEVMQVKSEPWARLDAETLIQLNPDRILFLARSTEDAKMVQSEFHRLFAKYLDAITKDQFYVYDDPNITIPGPEMGRRQQKLCERLKSL